MNDIYRYIGIKSLHNKKITLNNSNELIGLAQYFSTNLSEINYDKMHNLAQDLKTTIS